MATIIGTASTLGNSRRWPLVALLAILLGGCAEAFFTLVGSGADARNLREQAGIVFDAEYALKLDVYAPKDAAAAPVVVFFYGGSWVEGHRRWYRYVGQALANHGVIAVIPDYRKYPDVRFPAFMRDAALAVGWARAHATEFGGNAQRLFVMGHSAGGQIAALLACDKRYLTEAGMQPRDLAGMIGIAGAYTFLPFVDAEPEIFGNDARGRYDSQPINFVDGDEPPMLLLQGDDDDEVPADNARAMAERAQAMDGTAQLKIYPGVEHSSIMLAFAREHVTRVPALADALAFIEHPPALPDTSIAQPH